jgi:NADPH:quinone reductase-like Zn-dependent oxidoreductase
MAVAQILDENLQYINQKFIQGIETTTNTLALGNGASSTNADQIILQSGGDHVIHAPQKSGFFVDPVASVSSGHGFESVHYDPNNSEFVFESGSSNALIHSGEVVTFSNLPTSDPNNAGQLWNNSGVLNISSG